MFVLRGQRAVQLHNKMFKHHSSPSKFVEMVMLLTCIQQVKIGQDSTVTVATRYKFRDRISRGKFFHIHPEWVSFPRYSRQCVA